MRLKTGQFGVEKTDDARKTMPLAQPRFIVHVVSLLGCRTTSPRVRYRSMCTYRPPACGEREWVAVSTGRPSGKRARRPHCLFVRNTAPILRAPRTTATCQLRGPTSPPPDYTRVDRAPHNALFMATFQRALDGQLHTPLSGTGYDRVARSIRALAIQYRASDSELRRAALEVLRNLIPLWLPRVFRAVFVRFDTELSAKMCALVTVVTTQWLMGHSKISAEDRSIAEIERCRYLEEAGCVNVCINSCKLPTQQYFEESKFGRICLLHNALF